MEITTTGSSSSIPLARGHEAATALLVAGGGILLLIVLVLVHVTQGQAQLELETVWQAIFWPDGSIEHNLVRQLRLPRTTIGILAGAALGMSGVLFQNVTRNPLASPATLGVNAGAYFAVVATTIFAPTLFGWSPLLVAFGGGVLAALLVYGITATVSVTPVRLALAGMAVSLALAALTATLQIFYEEQTAGLFFWGAGTLVQIDWHGPAYAWPRLLVGGILALLLARPLEILLLGDEVARSLGQRVAMTRLAATFLAVLLASVAVSTVGPIGFVGLVAPHLVRLVGVRRPLLLLPGAALWGAALLVGADVLARLATTNVSELPTGAVTALLGAPFLLWLTKGVGQKERAVNRTSDRRWQAGGLVRQPYPLLLGGSLLLLVATFIGGLLLGNSLLTPGQLLELLQGGGSDFLQRVVFDLRLPRLLVALLAGASLGVSGLLLQGVVRNPLAGPEVIGITSGAGVGALAILILFPDLPAQLVPVAAFGGALVAFGVVYLASWQGGVAPERLALVGIAVSAFCAAMIKVLVVMASMRAALALVWLSGSTYARGWDELARLVGWPLFLLPLGWIMARWLDLLALGEELPKSLGLSIERARGLLLALAVALAAAAVAAVGTIGFVGLIAPHTARLLAGGRHRQLVPLTAILGGTLVMMADVAGRVLLAPKEIPSGLVTALIGAPFFLMLLYRGRAGRGA